MVKLNFFRSKLSKQPFLLKLEQENVKFQNAGRGQGPFYSSPSDTYGCVHSVNVGEFMSWLTFF